MDKIDEVLEARNKHYEETGEFLHYGQFVGKYPKKAKVKFYDKSNKRTSLPPKKDSETADSVIDDTEDKEGKQNDEK